MRPLAFIDAGFWIAWMDAADQYHDTVMRCSQPLQRDVMPVTSDFVIHETITYLNCSLKAHGVALAFLDLLHKGRIPVWRVEPDTIVEAMTIFRQYADKPFSFTDCTSFALMRRRGVTLYAGFDEHFKSMGYQPMLALNFTGKGT
jgi:predicted nucleic acid-binding protein